MKNNRPVEMIDGFSASAWKSLAVKSLRIGWPEGLRQAEARIGKSDMKAILICGTFEDIFPAVTELADVSEEIRNLHYMLLCRRDTHHGRPHTEEFCNLEPRAVEASQKQRSELWAKGKHFGVWLPQRSLNCWWTWLEIKPDDAGKARSLDLAPWTGMPAVMLDGHTLEGKRAGTTVTLLSGHYHQHRKLGVIVKAHGWEALRNSVHASPIVAPEGSTQIQLI